MISTTTALVLTAAAAAASAYSSYSQGQAAKAAGSYQSAVMRNNAILAQRASADALARGKIAEDQRAVQGNQLLGKQRATLAANGVVVNQDSALDINADTAASNQYDKLMIRHNAETESNSYLAQGMNYNANADLATLRGNNAATAGEFGAGTSLLNGASTVADKWYRYNPSGSSGSFNYPSNITNAYDNPDY